MNTEPTAKISGYEQLKKLRTALAIAEGTRLIVTLQQEAEATVSHDQTKRVTYLTGLFSRIHRRLFCHWMDQSTVSHRPGTITRAETRKKFRQAIGRLVLDGDRNKHCAIFDNNGFIFNTDDIAARLADFYRTMRTVRPFAYGNRITLDFFMTVLGKLPAFTSVYEQGIDFRRLEARDTVAMHDPTSPREAISVAFQHALDPRRNPSVPNQPNGYGKWPENKTMVSGIPFLSHTTESGVECLVLVNGGLVPVDTIDEDLFLAGKHVADYPLNMPEDIIDYLPGTRHLRRPEKHEIDGISVAENRTAPLFCLDVNILSGLRASNHTEFLELLRQRAGAHASIFALANNQPLRDRLLAAANGDQRLKRSVEIAFKRLTRMAKKLENTKELVFQGKTPSTEPTLFLCMGGAGSGKTAVLDMAQAHCGNNFVVASLDEFRKESDLYRVLTAANHHSDDYVYVEPFANGLRDLVATHAKNARINLVYDGTGIPYSPRYSTIVSAFKEAGFRTQIVAVDAFIVKPKGREAELPRSGVIGSVKARYEETGRALPWVITVYKHIRAPESFLTAVQDTSLDKIALFANDGERNKHYLVAESFPFSDQQVNVLHAHQQSGTLAQHLENSVRMRDDAIVKQLAKGDTDAMAALMDRNPGYGETNVAYQVYPSKDGNRVLVIYNTRRMVDFVEKRQLNPNASGEEGLLHSPASLLFYVDPMTHRPGMTRLQGTRRP